MIPEFLLTRLADDFSLPAESRRAFAQTLRQEDLWRDRRRQNVAALRRPPVESIPYPPAVLVYDCLGTEVLPGSLIEDPSGSPDPTANRGYANTRAMAEFCQVVFCRNSIDDAGMTLVSSIHYSRSYCNAFWDGRQMTYGDGDGLIFLDFTRSNDFIGHELAHGITQYTAGLIYEDEPGALNESVSDVFGSMFRQWTAGQKPHDADWVIGSDLMGPTALAHGWTSVRDLAHPDSPHSLTQQPTKYSQYVPGGDPHVNSGIPNRAFYLAASSLNDYSWVKAGKIWYAALTDPEATTTMTLREFAALTIAAASSLFPGEKQVRTAVESAWKAVEILP